jgi:hypothetical protein
MLYVGIAELLRFLVITHLVWVAAGIARGVALAAGLLGSAQLACVSSTSSCSIEKVVALRPGMLRVGRTTAWRIASGTRRHSSRAETVPNRHGV